MEFNEKHGEINLKMAGNDRLLVKRMKVKVLFAKILRVYGAGTLQNPVQRIRKWEVIQKYFSSKTCLMKIVF